MAARVLTSQLLTTHDGRRMAHEKKTLVYVNLGNLLLIISVDYAHVFLVEYMLSIFSYHAISSIIMKTHLGTTTPTPLSPTTFRPFHWLCLTCLNKWYLSKVVRDNYFNTDYKSLLRFYSLKKTYQKRNTFAYLLEDNVYKKKLDNAAVVFESPLNMILFNPLGIHTGGFCYKGKRKALQVTLTKCN